MDIPIVVLIVEDDPGVRDVLSQVMEMERIRYLAVSDGQEAVMACKTLRPSLVILDVNLPKMSGIAVAHELRHIHGPDLPILVMTADGHAREKSEQAHATAYLMKPFTLPAFLEMVYSLIGEAHERGKEHP